jgi:tetratricopeptide (TPR) repeat protein
MIDWLRLLPMILYAPIRGMREVRDRGSLAPVAFLAFLAQAAYSFVTERFAGAGTFTGGRLAFDLFESAKIVVLVAVILVPILTLVANTFERRGSFRVVITQEYAPVAATMFYVLTVANVFAILFAIVFHYSVLQAEFVALMIQNADENQARWAADNPEAAAVLRNPAILAQFLFLMPKMVLFSIGTVLGVKDVFRTSAVRAFGIVLVSGTAALFVGNVAYQLLSGVLGSPFLLILLFILLRGYFGDIMGSQRAKAAFKQNLESATLNPADASAHYNLGLIHQSRGELDAARERFERALQIDGGEIDASFQLGRIAQQQKRFADAIQHFEHVVMQDPAHSQYEIWLAVTELQFRRQASKLLERTLEETCRRQRPSMRTSSLF